MPDIRILLVVFTLGGHAPEKITPMPDWETCQKQLKEYKLLPNQTARCEKEIDY